MRSTPIFDNLRKQLAREWSLCEDRFVEIADSNQEAQVADQHHQTVRDTEIVGEGQYVNPGAELARRAELDAATPVLNDDDNLATWADNLATWAEEKVAAGLIPVAAPWTLPDGSPGDLVNAEGGVVRVGVEITEDDGTKRTPKTVEAKLLADAAQTVNGDRQDRYGNPEDSFQVIADFWNTYLSAMYGLISTISPFDVAMMMDLLKTARLTQTPGHRDSLVDKAGYTALAERTLRRDIEDGVAEYPDGDRGGAQ